jgi:hypothetical protein
MYCPNCGQQQVSDEMRFCSRCGLALSGLADWLARGGVPANRAEEAPVPVPTPRRKKRRAAAKLMFVSGVLLPVFFVLSLIVGDGAPMVVPIILFFVSSVIMLYTRLFRDETSHVKTHDAQTTALNSMSARGSLPPASNVSVPGAGRQRVRTNELAQPPSVTEHTTKLLDNE